MEKKIVNLMIFVLILVVGLTTGVADADITTGLVSWWAFNDGSGNTAVDSASGIDGTLKPGQPDGPTWAVGKIDDCLEFDVAKQNYVECGPHPALDITGSLTLAAWVKKIGPWIGSGGDLRYDTIIYKRISDGSTRAYRLSRDAAANAVGLTVNTVGGEVKVRGATAVNDDEWHHVAGVYDMENTQWFLYVDAVEDTGSVAASASGNINGSSGQPLLIGSDGGDLRYWGGLIDEVRIYARALSAEDIRELYESNALATPRGNARRPSPVDGVTDVPANVVLSWTPGEYAPAINGHRVYLSESFSDVNDGVGGTAQDANSYTPAQQLNFGTTYYWRVDEVNAPPDSTVFNGNVWSFTTEPVGYPVDGANITATASSTGEADFGPEKTIDGSGLDENSLHSTEPVDMWISGSEPLGAWIQYEFNNMHKLHQMWVWNSNQIFEALFGFGLKDVTVEYSTNGTDWTALAGVPEFAQAPGIAGYAHDTTVDFGGALAKYVRLTAASNWGGILPQYGLSEVRFFYIPLSAREPSPDSGATDVDVDVVLGWRAGREAATHDVYLSTDEQAVIDGTAPVTVVTETSHSPSSLDLDSTYYWRIDEVNDAEIPTTWQGDIWNLLTQEYLVVDDFESYNDIEAGQPGSNLVYLTWVDGFDNPTTNGSTMGYPTGVSMETGAVHGGRQSAPLQYDNTTAALSEVTRTLAAQNWTTNGIQTLSLWFLGDPANVPGQLYVKVNNAEVPFNGSAAAISRPFWTQWNVDLGAVGTDLSRVNTLTIGIEGGSGIIYVDDIRLYAKAAEFIIPPFIVAVEDAWVREANPDTNFGAPAAADSDRLRWNSEAGEALALSVRNRSFIKFEVSANVPESVQLVLNRTNGGVPMEIRLAASNDWDESTITWNNQPAFGDVVIASGDPGGGLNSFDVSDYITGAGTYSFVVVGVADPGENAGTFESKDAGGNNPPILEFRLGP
ncbi:MAG: LamG-like jellyroll fold domain-containing protein [Planctomycetota bacterium]|jgi:hypothetical protein